MSAVVIIICVPTEKHEMHLGAKGKCKKPASSVLIPGIEPVSPITEVGSFTSPDKIKRRFSTNSLAEYKSMEKVVQGLLADLNVPNATWCRREGGNYVQVTLALDSNARCEEALATLREHGIGRLHHSTVSVLPCTVHYSAAGEADMAGTRCPQGSAQPLQKECEQSTAWHRFLLSVRARLTVAEVVENVRSRATFTFDFVCLLLIATILCAIGLVENSIMYLLSSMLISPMMGPVMAGTFGSVIRDRRLQTIGVHNELIGLGIATVVGFCYGAIVCFATDKYGEHDWPTYEMTSRGELRTLWVGCLIALLAGAAVALGVLSDNIASLVGVAISTSLMPPAVNAGLLWSVAAVYYVKHDPSRRYSSLTRTNIYSTNPLIEYVTMGAVSICLTFVNIVCIYVAGILVFKIKEVAPIASKYHARKQFWKHDIRIARDYYKTIQSGEVANLYRTLPQEIDTFRRQHNLGEGTGCLHHSTEVAGAAEGGRCAWRRCQYTWSPCMHLHRTPHMKEVTKMFLNLEPEISRGRAAKELDFTGVGCSLQPGTSQYRRLSQIFPAPARSRPDLSVNASINPSTRTEATVRTTLQPPQKCAKKFVVTPSTYSTF